MACFKYLKSMGVDIKYFVAGYTLLLSLAVTEVSANQVKIVEVELVQSEGELWNISVTLNHKDKDWDHFANAWRVVDKNGEVLAKRVLAHPHVDEQPFTRRLQNVNIPQSKRILFIEAHDLVHGWTPHRLKIDMKDAVDGKLKSSP